MTKRTSKKQTTDEASVVATKAPALTYIEPKIPTIYVNHAQFMATILDASIVFGEIAGAGKNGILQIYPRIKLAMSQEFARELHSLLDRNLAAMAKDNQDSDTDNSVQ